jgi:phosphoribosylaminoimidazolecarboxamide formyltransferase / IMP cyclohydrolase
MMSMYGDNNPLDLTSTDGFAVGEDEDGQTIAMSYNNYVDADSAIGLCAEIHREIGLPAVFAAPTCVFIKHTNACGVGVADDPAEAYRLAYFGDPNAAMGGILAVNFKVDADFANAIMGTLKNFKDEIEAGTCEHPPQAFFVEVIIATSFDDDAVHVIRSAKTWGQRVRLLEIGDMDEAPTDESFDCRRIAGGMLIQSPDLVGLNQADWRVVTDRTPSESELQDLRLAWLVCKHTKSNAISICKDRMLIGNGAGQMSRVMSCRIATWLAKENGHAEKLAGAAAASDAFFPFRDGLDILIDAGVTAIIQPGGSKRDDEVIAAANERGIAMIMTGTRHFKH